MKRVFTLSALAGLLAAGLLAQPQFEDTPEQKAAKAALEKANKDAQAAHQAAYSSDSRLYGFQPGTVSGFINFAPSHITDLNGMHLGAEGGVEVGVHKYIGVFAQGAWTGLSASASGCYSGYYGGVYCASANARADYFDAGGGVEVIGTNHTRFVPYGKFGVGYMLARASGSMTVPGIISVRESDSIGSPTLLYGAGVKTYLTHHFGVDAGFTAYTAIGGNVRGTAIAPTIGVFFQSK